jgi:NADH dehydrogenase [ubiquinone] 1 alpha subcomplex assembly factor 2
MGVAASCPANRTECDETETNTLSNPAQWHQWLRHVREHPPSIEEQKHDLIRQAQIKQLAKLADERWASKASFLDKPKTQPGAVNQPAGPSLSHPIADTQAAQDAPASAAPPNVPKADPASTAPETKKENPWAKASQNNPGEEWQPEAWSPTSKR